MTMKLRYLIPLVALVTFMLAVPPERLRAWHTGSLEDRLVAAAIEQTRSVVIYDGSYRAIAYPWGDVAPNRGVCTDVIIRVYRDVGIDLQQLMRQSLGGDPNIVHRRVTEMRRFFSRHGKSMRPSRNPDDYKPGDLVTSIRSDGVTHIVIVTGRRSWDGERPLVVHNQGYGPKLDDALFKNRITGHYRFLPRSQGQRRADAGQATDV
jgi:uncharacterized protein YijF (DUF1287 family)